MKTALLLLLTAATGLAATDHVHWTMTADSGAAGGRTLAHLTAAIDEGWHLYSITTPPGGPIPTTVKVNAPAGLAGFRIFEPKPVKKFDPNFNIETETYEGTAVFLIELELAKDAAAIVEVTAAPRYQVCSATTCIPPVTRTASARVALGGSAAAPTIPADYREAKPAIRKAAAGAPGVDPGLGAFLLTALGFGLASIFTPCVFPMIPITMSFFLNQGAATRRKSILQALLFCGGIVVFFSVLGLATSALLGASGVKQLSSNPWVNGLIAGVFFVFGLSLLGAFEITLPSSLLTNLNKASEGGGVLPTLLMGLTFSLTSFACVGPFMGSLLAASVEGGGLRPLLGMAMFAIGLAAPFFLLALFPRYLQKLPRSGGWLARVKVVMGFVILAAMLKYLSAVDLMLQWNWLPRERFLAVWIALFGIAGLYLLGFVRLPGIKKDEELGLGRLFAGLAFVIFAITLVPGMFGARLGELDAYVPPPSGSAPGAASGAQALWLKNDLDGALAKARAEHKKVLVNFTGYACTNCHWMKSNMFPRPEIAAALQDFVLVDLYTDGEDAASQANQKLEESKFNTIAIPFYAVYEPGAGAEPTVVATFPGLTRKPAEYLAFLKTAPEPGAGAQTAAVANGSGELAGVALARLGGGAFPAAELDGKVVVLNFWATYCIPCRQEIPSFNLLSKKYEARGLQVIGVDMDEDTEGVPAFLATTPIHYPMAAMNAALKSKFQVEGLPVTVVLDRSGKIVQRFEGFTKPDAIEAAVQRSL